jgi:hypothetical protein
MMNARKWFHKQLSQENQIVVTYLKTFIERHPNNLFAREMLDFWNEQEEGVAIIEKNRDLIEEAL